MIAGFKLEFCKPVVKITVLWKQSRRSKLEEIPGVVTNVLWTRCKLPDGRVEEFYVHCTVEGMTIYQRHAGDEYGKVIGKVPYSAETWEPPLLNNISKPLLIEYSN